MNNNHLIALILAIVTLMPCISIPSFAFVYGDYSAYSIASSDPYERKAAYIHEAMKVILDRLRNASSGKDPTKDIDLQQALSSFFIDFEFLRANAHLHVIRPPDLKNIRDECARLTGALDYEYQKNLNDIEDARQLEREELEHARGVYDRLTLRFKLIPIAGMSQALIAVLDSLNPVSTLRKPGIKELVEQLLSLVMGPVLEARVKEELRGDTKIFYLKHKDYVDQKVTDWVRHTYPDLDPQTYYDHLRKREDMRSALLNRIFFELREVGKTEMAKSQQTISKLNKYESTLRNRNRNVIDEYKKICIRMEGLLGWPNRPYQPGIRINKTANPKTITQAATVTYTYEVENTGNCPLSNIAVTDSICAPVSYTGGDIDANRRLDETEKWTYECSMTHSSVGTITNTANSSAADPSGTQVNSTATEMITVTPEIVAVPNLIGHKREFAEQLIKDAKLAVGIAREERSELAVGIIFKQEPDYGMRVPVGTNVNIWVSQNEPRYIYIDPPRETKKLNEKVTFGATLIYKDGKEEEIVPPRLARWEPGPDNTFTCKEPGKFIISSEYRGASGSATVTCEEDWSAPVFEPPISKSGQRHLRAQPAPPEAYTWYVLCDTYTWDVVYGEHVNVARYQIVAGPFPGPRTAQDWIERNIPSRRCPPATGGGEWAVVCDRNTGSIGLTRSPNPQRHLALRGGFYGEPDARRWTEQNCPSWRCDSEGRCLAGTVSTSAGTGREGNWAVVCNKNHGGVGLTQHPDPTREWIWGHGFFSEPDARRWTEQNCQSWRCDANGKCMTGIAAPRSGVPPLEVPPSSDSGRFRTDQGIPPPKAEGRESQPPLRESAPEKTLPPAPPQTSGLGKPPSAGAPSVDNIPYKNAYGKRCTDMRDSYVNKVCTPVWSGCALVPVGCMGYVITGALPDQSTPARSQCGKAVLENYLSCLQSCNNRLIAAELNMDSVGGCGAMCNETAVAETKACDAGAAPPSPTASSGSKPPIPKLEVAEESPLKILAGDWEFGRTQAPKPWPVGKISVLKLTLQRGKWGYIIAEPHHPNESFWELSGDTLLIKHADGSVTGRLTRKNPKDWHYWEGPYIPHKSVPTSGVRHYIKKAR